MKTKKLRPNQHLWRFNKKWGDVFTILDHYRDAKGGPDLGDWPDWCYLPVAASYAVVSAGADNMMCDQGSLADIAVISSLAAWRTGMSIYRFDQDLYESLINTPVSNVPVEALYRLPEWGVYVETPGMDAGGEQLHGFFSHLEHDTNNSRPELRILLDVDTGLYSIPLHITQKTITRMLEAMLNESRKNDKKWDFTVVTADIDIKRTTTLLSRLISLVLYLCSDKPDTALPRRPKIKRTKKGLIYKPKPQPTVREVGFNIGKEIRTAAEGKFLGSGDNTVSAHIRKAHWHSYWKGPRSGEQHLIIKWLSPILVNPNGEPLEITTIKKVK